MKPFGLDALLGKWPAQDPQEKGGLSWDERADVIVRAAVAQKDRGSPEIVDALVAAPRLEAEPGEDKAESFDFHDGATDRDQRAARPVFQPGESQPMSTDQPKKPSLKELAARASQAGAGRSSVTPLPPAGRASTPSPATVTPITKAKSARGSDAGREDSGMLRLADIQAEQAQKEQAARAAAEAKPADKPGVAAAAAPVIARPAQAPAGGGGSAGMWAGVAIAVLGIAAAFAVYRTRQPETAPAKTAENAVKPQTAPAANDAPKPKGAEQPAVVASSDPGPAASDAPKGDVPAGAGASGAPAASGAAVALNEAKPATSGTAAAKGGKVGTLEEEMKKSVGPESQPAPQDESKPASGSNGGNIPDQPSQGNAQAAIRAVLPAARACVAGAPENSSASITFGSSGSVQSVSVSGWAAANGKAACVKSALQGAHVAPFARPTFTAPATIRP